MTGSQGPIPGPPWPLELLADLHAGVLDERTAAELTPRVQADPEARAVLAALDATVADLAALPAPPMPEHLAARIDAALTAEAHPSQPTQTTAASGPHRGPAAVPAASPGPPPPPPGAAVVDLAARRRKRRGTIAGASLLTVAAAAAGFIAVIGIDNETAGTPQASEQQPLALTRDSMDDALNQVMSESDFGPLSQPDALEECLSANGMDQAVEPLGAREITLDGRPGVLMVLPTGQEAEFRMLVVGPDCGPGNPSLMADHLVGR